MAALPFRRPASRAPLALWPPGLAVVAATLVPAWYLLRRSTERGWAPWEEVLREAAWPLLARSLQLALVVAVACVLVALPAAWLTTRTDLPFRRAWSVLMAAPLAIPSYVMGMTVVEFLGPKGMLQGWLEPLGVERLPEIYGLWGAAFTLTAVSFPYVYLVLRGALGTASVAEEEASRSLGVPPWPTFFRIVLPGLAPAIAAGLLLVVLYVLSDFGGVSTLNYNTFTRDIFLEYQSSFDRTRAAVLACVLVGVAAVILAAEMAVRRRAGGRASRRTAPPRPVPLGRWRWPAIGFLALVVLASLALPLGVLGYWLVRGLQVGANFPDIGEAARHSLAMGLAAAVLTVALALPLAILAARYGGAGASLLEQVAYLTHALPGLVVALSLVFFGIRYAQAFYQTTWMLLFAYLVLFVPNALSALRANLLRLPPRLEEAGTSLGRRPLVVLATVTIPLARPGMGAAAALVFLTVLKELPATLLLSPPGFETLPGLTWGRTSDALYAGAALPALVLVGLALIPLVVLAWRGDPATLES
ncbi:ABC transporter permease [Tepidiforma thermophila]|uniref:Iron(III) transport system permease protein n=1 Tax=Tepidiforma thermophila (strain KCTC 52669 / CGMCC 1.13589 / G233) TaxID=2761530 RepID=A0A2A9HD98_TEPT2|nr:iron ABC transporter permease [Tepidiforma thermophila]PFG73293.1 iron(III) transport system permease protein [Tepidiforma thermophila]